MYHAAAWPNEVSICVISVPLQKTSVKTETLCEIEIVTAAISPLDADPPSPADEFASKRYFHARGLRTEYPSHGSQAACASFFGMPIRMRVHERGWIILTFE